MDRYMSVISDSPNAAAIVRHAKTSVMVIR